MFQGKVHELVADILKSYDELGGINHIKGSNLPSRESVIGILRDLESLIFPGFQDSAISDCDTLPYTTAQRVFGIIRALIREVSKSLKYRTNGYSGTEEALSQEAETICFELLGKVPHLRKTLSMDVEAFYEGDPAARSTDEIVLSYPGMAAILVHRIAHELYKSDVPLIPRMMSEYIHRRTGIDIHPGAQIGNSFFIDHGTGVVIGETCVIGNGVKIYQGVTLGALSVKKNLASVKRHPTIGNDVTIYAGATILGGETTVGRNSVVGGNVWLTKSIPPYSVVSMRPQEHLVGSKVLNVIDYQI